MLKNTLKMKNNYTKCCNIQQKTLSLQYQNSKTTQKPKDYDKNIIKQYCKGKEDKPCRL